MMRDRYFLTDRQARLCRMIASVFLLVAAMHAIGGVVNAVVPEYRIAWSDGRWHVARAVADLLPDDTAATLSTPAARAAFNAYVAQPAVRLGLAALSVMVAWPFAALLGSLGLAMRRLAVPGPQALALALPWLRRAAVAALLLTVARFLSDSLYGMLLIRGTPEGPHWLLIVDFELLVEGLMLAGAAYAVIWAMDAGVRAGRDLADFV